MTLTREGLAALRALDRGARFNALHGTARELITHGFADDNFGGLSITELGRRIARRTYVVAEDEHMASLGDHVAVDPARYPMGRPAAAEPLILPIAEETTPTPAPAPARSASERGRDRALRAAGVASGRTQMWVDEKWVMEFIAAFESDDAA